MGDVALTGTPGTGKSSVARALHGSPPTWEVADWAVENGCGKWQGGIVVVDLTRFRRRMATGPDRNRPGLWVGHLAHLLGVEDAIVLRCHPRELRRRLRRSGRRSAPWIQENVEAEAVDQILIEALSRARRVWEVDTSSRTVDSVAHEVRRLFRGRPPSRFGRIDWLADPTVTEHLLRRRR